MRVRAEFRVTTTAICGSLTNSSKQHLYKKATPFGFSSLRKLALLVMPSSVKLLFVFCAIVTAVATPPSECPDGWRFSPKSGKCFQVSHDAEMRSGLGLGVKLSSLLWGDQNIIWVDQKFLWAVQNMGAGRGWPPTAGRTALS